MLRDLYDVIDDEKILLEESGVQLAGKPKRGKDGLMLSTRALIYLSRGMFGRVSECYRIPLENIIGVRYLKTGGSKRLEVELPDSYLSIYFPNKGDKTYKKWLYVLKLAGKGKLEQMDTGFFDKLNEGSKLQMLKLEMMSENELTIGSVKASDVIQTAAGAAGQVIKAAALISSQTRRRNAAGSKSSSLDEITRQIRLLQELERLRDAGIISEDEFEHKKDEIINI